MMHLLGVGVVLESLWLVLSGHWNFQFIFLGFVSIAMVIVITWRMDVVEGCSIRVPLTFLAPAYWLWLTREVMQSNLYVTRLIIHPKMHVKPQVLVIEPGFVDVVGHTILANSITLTPGTLTLFVDDHELIAHAVDEKTSADFLSGGMRHRVARMIGPK